MRLAFVKIVTILVDYISIVFGLLAAYQLRLSLPETFVSLNFKIDNIYIYGVNVNIRMYNFDDVQCTVIPSVAYGFVTGMNLQLC